jgi:hypothetical protein
MILQRCTRFRVDHEDALQQWKPVLVSAELTLPYKMLTVLSCCRVISPQVPPSMPAQYGGYGMAMPAPAHPSKALQQSTPDLDFPLNAVHIVSCSVPLQLAIACGHNTALCAHRSTSLHYDADTKPTPHACFSHHSNSTGHEQPFNPVFLGGVAPFSGMYGPPLPQQHQYHGQDPLLGRRGPQQQLDRANGYEPHQQYQHQQQRAPRHDSVYGPSEYCGPVGGPAAGSTSGLPAAPKVLLNCAH